MTRYFSSLLYLASTQNKEVQFSLSAIGEHYHRMVDFEDSRNRSKIEEALGALDKIPDQNGINTLSVIEGIRAKYKNQPSQEHRMEIIFTDGGETSRRPFPELRAMLDELEKELNIDIVFVGLGTPAVSNYSKFIDLPKGTQAQTLIQIILSLSLLKAEGNLPPGDLGAVLGLNVQGKIPEVATMQMMEQTPIVAPVADQSALTQKEQLTDQKSPAQNPGGIDISTDKLNLEVQRDPNEKPLSVPLPSQDILGNPLLFDGFTPVIIQIVPVNNLPDILGLQEPPQRELYSQLKT